MLLRDETRELAQAIDDKDVGLLMSLMKHKQIELETRTQIIHILDDTKQKEELHNISECITYIHGCVNVINGILEDKIDRSTRKRKS